MTPSRKGKETSTFDAWLRGLQEATHGLQLVRALDLVAQLAAEAFGARLWFVRILGRRWSYLAGYRSQTPTASPIERICLGDGDFGLVSEDWGRLSNEQRQRLITFLGEMVARARPTRR